MLDRRAPRAARCAGVDRRRGALRLPGGPRSPRAAVGAAPARGVALPAPRRAEAAVAPVRDGESAIRMAGAAQPPKGAVVTNTKLLTVAQLGAPRAAVLHDLPTRMA